MLLYSSNLLLGFPTGQSFTSSTTRQQVLWHYSSPRHQKQSTKQKPNLLIFIEASRSPKRRWRGATGQPHHRAVRPAPGLRPLWVRPPWSTSYAAPSPIKTSRQKKPKYPINFLETHRDPPSSSTQDREGPEALPGTLPERGITTGGLLRRHACLRCDE
jgi:hypothetical protein